MKPKPEAFGPETTLSHSLSAVLGKGCGRSPHRASFFLMALPSKSSRWGIFHSGSPSLGSGPARYLQLQSIPSAPPWIRRGLSVRPATSPPVGSCTTSPPCPPHDSGDASTHPHIRLSLHCGTREKTTERERRPEKLVQAGGD